MTVSEPVRLAGPGEIIAAVPSILGFYPTNSVVALFVTDGELRCGMRSDADVRAAFDALDGLRAAVASTGASAVVLIAVADDDHADDAAMIVRSAVNVLADSGVGVSALSVAAIDVGAQFADLLRGTAGTVPDPMDCPIMVEAIRTDRPVARSRSVLEERYRPGVEIPRQAQAAAAHARGSRLIAVTMEELVEVVRSRQLPSDDLSARIGFLLGQESLTVRDSFAYSAHYGHQAAATAMLQIAARLRGRERAHAMALVALISYIHDGSAQTRLAIDAAFAAVEDIGAEVPKLVDLLHQAYGVALPGEQFAGCIPAKSVVERVTGAVLPTP
ncbi:DUF4192 domain-containing protein [Rhodococcus sp. BS-15]|uniref:DUF4192 domain-containing protein n=1 Tax=Rhodococcus sp. BS-15 TaxID=1304954 RepID=UPI000A7986C8|nr:DUF4192 domain-containing protein [Rhodococcus sp. BS-15]